MSTSPLPSDPKQLQEVFDQVSVVDICTRSALGTLRELEDRPQPATLPVRVDVHPLGCFSIVQHLTPWARINEDLQDLAERTLPIMVHLGLRSKDEESIRTLAPPTAPASGTEVDPSPVSPGPLFLVGMIDDSAMTGVEARQETEGNRLRIKVLMDLLERLLQATATLSRSLCSKLHPPSIRERVAVDVTKGLGIVDGKEYQVTESVALLFKHLVDANGLPVSGPHIAKAEGMKEFKAGRAREQIKRKQLKQMVKKDKRPNDCFYIELPPLD